MNRPERIPTAAEVAVGATYVMTPDDFRSGMIVTDAATGREYMVGETWTGLRTRTALNVPLCDGCDQPVPADGWCENCEVQHAPELAKREIDKWL
jgi:hypothetical protein